MNDDEYDDKPQPTPEGLIDHEAIEQIVEKAKDALRPLGLTLHKEGVNITIHEGQVWAIMPCIIRPSAKERLTQDEETRKQLNQMLASQHEAMIDSEAEKIRRIASDPEKLRDFFLGDGVEEDTSDCEHLRPHPDGFCMDCGQMLV